MTIPVSDIQFGEADAKNEVFQQARYGSEVLRNAFQIPPKIDFDDLLRGARFFISGQKGCGKTALLLQTQRILADQGASTQIVLFKTGVSEDERAKLAAGSGVEIIQTGDGYKAEYDYTTNWLWFIYRNLIRMIDHSKVLEGADTVADLKKLVGVHHETRVSTFSDLAISKVKAAAKAGMAAGPFHSEISAEVELAGKENSDRAPLEIIEICERYLTRIRLQPRHRCLIFFDELELFWNRKDQRERDLFLIRDLLQSVARVNRALGAHSAWFVVYASVRSEVLEEVNRVGPEIVRDITDFGVGVSWNVRSSADNQPILAIVDAKIQASEIDKDELPTDDVWNAYFPKRLFGKSIQEHLLDVSMFKPRNIVSRLNLAKAYDLTAETLSEEAFEETTIDYSQSVWREIEEELLGSYSRLHVANLKAILTGFRARFTVLDLERRIATLGAVDSGLTEGFRGRSHVVEVCRALYRVGAVGNSFSVPGKSGGEKRDRWSFRDMGDPTIDETFVVHESLRKVFQLSYHD